jgi:hypothetical protein
VELCKFQGGKGNGTVGKIPQEADICLNKEERRVTLLDVPRDTERSKPRGSLFLVVRVREVAIDEGAILYQNAEDIHIIFVLGNWAHTLRKPDVNNRITSHACIATRRGCTEGVAMVNVEFFHGSLHHKPMLVMWADGADMMEFTDIEGTSLSTLRSMGDLDEWAKKFIEHDAITVIQCRVDDLKTIMQQ